MTLFELVVIAIGLAMDAFAVSICKGLVMRRIHYGAAFAIALCFGAFQAGMPLLGWLLGETFAAVIDPFDHWVAFGLLAYVGIKMIWDAIHENTVQNDEVDQKLNIKELLMLGIATSIDAFAVGISFALLDVSIVPSIIIIGVITFALSFLGVVIGNIFGGKFKSKATLFGGIVLVVIGVRILFDGLGLIG